MRSIFVVDDSHYVVEVLVTMLEQGGYHTFSAYGGEECLGTLKTVTPDLLILDVMMKPMDGWTTLEKIKENPATADTPVIMHTSNMLTPDEAGKYSALIEDYLLKPVTNYDLYDAIENVLQRRQMIRWDADRARQAGIDSKLVDEYACLSRSIEVNKRCLKILETTFMRQGRKTGLSDNVSNVLKNVETDIDVQEARYRQIREELEKSTRLVFSKCRS